MTDEKNRGLGGDHHSEAPKPQKDYDGSSDSKNGAEGQAEKAERYARERADFDRRQKQIAANIKLATTSPTRLLNH